jgi:hypothetical protein
MPTKRRPVRARLSLVPFRYRKWLLCGRPAALDYLEPEKVQALWAEYGEAVMQQHIAKWPGTRPVCWWRYSSSERRDPSQESEFAFLKRHGLLQLSEIRERRRAGVR